MLYRCIALVQWQSRIHRHDRLDRGTMRELCAAWRDCSGKAAHTTGFTAEQHLLQCGGGGTVGEVQFGVAIDVAAAVLVLVR